MKPHFAFVPLTSRIAAMVVSFALLAPIAAIADCSEEEITAVFLVEGILFYSSQDTASFWHVDTFNCANLDSNTPDNHAW